MHSESCVCHTLLIHELTRSKSLVDTCRYTESGAIHDLFGPVTNKEVCFACSPVSVVVAQLASA
jgi:hypothetical protein